MSYDIMVFDPAAAPPKRPAFLDWYDAQTEWGDAHDYDDPAICSAALGAFYADIVQIFPPIQDDNEDEGTDYTIAAQLIYMSFQWDAVDQAHETILLLAGKHKLGVFDPSSDLAEVWLPDRKGGLFLAHAD